MEARQVRRSRCRRDAEFFARARARLTLDVPAGLTDPDVIPQARRPRSRSGDGGDRESAADPAGGGAGAGGRARGADGAAHAAHRASARPFRADRVSRRQDRRRTTTARLAAALREAEEEIGLERAFVEPIGYLDLYMTTLGFRIVPAVARVAPDFR